MQLSSVLEICRNLVFIFLCLACVLVAPSVGNLLCLGGSENSLVSHPIRKFFSEDDPFSLGMVAATKAHLSSVVFRGTLLSVLVQRDGTVKATFGIRKVLKHDSVFSGTVGELEVVYFKRPSAEELCIFDVNEDNLRLGTQYVVFGRSTKLGTLVASAFPIPFEKQTFRAVRKVVCKNCARPPRIEGLKSARVPERSKIRLHCHLSGNPIPWVEWYKDGKRLKGNRRIRVKTKRRTTWLIIRRSRFRDAGIYECRAVNIVKSVPVISKAKVTITREKPTTKPKQNPKTTTISSSWWPSDICPNSDFCLNGGTCMFFKDVREYVCHCAEGFMGLRCEHKDVRTSFAVIKTGGEHQNHLLFIIVGVIVVSSCLNWAALSACWLFWFRKRQVTSANSRQMATLEKHENCGDSDVTSDDTNNTVQETQNSNPFLEEDDQEQTKSNSDEVYKLFHNKNPELSKPNDIIVEI